jgi:chemotaxis protein CheC
VHETLNEAQGDALRELINIGAGHGAATLSRLLGGARLGFQPPEAREVTVEQLVVLLGGDSGERLTATMDVRGDAAGMLVLVLTPSDAEELGARLTGEPLSGAPAYEAPLEVAARAVASSALAAMGQLTGLFFEASPPTVGRSTARVLAQRWCDAEAVPVLHAALHGQGFAAQLLFLPARATLRALLLSLRV